MGQERDPGSGYAYIRDRYPLKPQTQDYAERIRRQFVAGNDFAVYEIMEELNEDQELFLEVWSQFSAPVRRALKEIQVQYRDK